MRILTIADRHPSKSIKSILNENPVDLICTLGDLHEADLQELAYIDTMPKIGVYGNHCSGNYFDNLHIINMHLRTFTYQKTIFGGFEGSVRYKESQYAKMYTQEEAFELLKNFPSVDVMITHSPPYGINDEPDTLSHQGFQALRQYVKEKKPHYLLHGHTYPTKETMTTKLYDTEIIYVYQEKIIAVSTSSSNFNPRG